jgi:DNA-binding CsgD family transcriptional regulator
MIATAQGAHDEAATLYQECLALGRKAGDTHFIASVLFNLGDQAIDQANLVAARVYLAESLQTFMSAANSELAPVLASFAGLAAYFDPHAALRLAGGTLALRRAQHAALSPTEQVRMERRIERARRVLGETDAQADWEAGEAMTLPDLVACALDSTLKGITGKDGDGLTIAASNESIAHAQVHLTTRELEVTTLLAQGFSNRQIADALVISVGTAEVHVKHVLAKLGFVSRGQITAWAFQQNSARREPPGIPTRRVTNT